MLIYQPTDSDVMGDRWASQTVAVWDKMRELDPVLCSVPGAYELWQYAHCYLAEMRHRVVASPQACAIAGGPVPLDRMDEFEALNDRAFEAIREEKAAAVA